MMKRWAASLLLLAAIAGVSFAQIGPLPGLAVVQIGGAPPCTGGSITYVGGNVVHTFTSSGTLTCPIARSVNYLLVAGGGGASSGDQGGGGGGGGVLTGSSSLSATSYSIGVGAGWQHGNYRIVEVVDFAVPSGKMVVGFPSYSIDADRGVVETYSIEDVPVPTSPPIPPITRWRFFQQLAVQGIISQDEALAAMGGTIPAPLLALIEQLPSEQKFPAKMLVIGATEFERQHHLTIAIGAAFGMDAAEIDAFFVAAGTL